DLGAIQRAVARVERRGIAAASSDQQATTLARLQRLVEQLLGFARALGSVLLEREVAADARLQDALAQRDLERVGCRAFCGVKHGHCEWRETVAGSAAKQQEREPARSLRACSRPARRPRAPCRERQRQQGEQRRAERRALCAAREGATQ